MRPRDARATASSIRSALARLCSWLGARLSIVGATLLATIMLSGHVGTNQVVFEGRAGGYPVRVFIDPPGVVPAQVPIMVRVLDGTPRRVTVRAAQWNLGTKGAPPAEDAALVPGEPGLWAHDLWIMTGSSYAVYVAVEGPGGNGSVLVPLQTSATRVLGMQKGMGMLLAVLGTLLVAGMLTIVGAAVREGTLEPGLVPDATRRRGGRIAMAAAAALLGLAVFGGAKWWDAEERAYRRRMLKPIALTSRVQEMAGGRRLSIAITDSLWQSDRMPPLILDHGKLMHVALVQADGAEVALAHLHPVRVHPDSFTAVLPALPPGRYRLFGDVLLQSGATRTLVDTVTVPTATTTTVAGDTGDADDAWRATTPVSPGGAASLAGGGTMTLRTDVAPVARRDLRLEITVTNADGTPAALEPYMGMQGHAFVMRRDGSFFMHLHPMGTASMTAQAQLARRERGDTTGDADSAAMATPAGSPAMTNHAVMGPAVMGPAVMDHAVTDHAAMAATAAPSHSGVVGFPFAFPGAGEYLVFAQVRRAGRVETAAFTVRVP